MIAIKQAYYLLLYEHNWLKEGTDGLVLKKTAESSKLKPIPNWQIRLAHSYSAILHKKFACFIKDIMQHFELTNLRIRELFFGVTNIMLGSVH